MRITIASKRWSYAVPRRNRGRGGCCDDRASCGARARAGNIPATVSAKIVTGVLRDELGFRGLVITDAMDMQGLAAMFDTAEASVRPSRPAPTSC